MIHFASHAFLSHAIEIMIDISLFVPFFTNKAFLTLNICSTSGSVYFHMNPHVRLLAGLSAGPSDCPRIIGS